MMIIQNQLKTKVLYGGKIKIEFKEGGHTYKANGERVSISATGVTGILDKPALKFWAVNLMRDDLTEFINSTQSISVSCLLKRIEEASKLHTQFKDKAANIGDMVHDYAEQYANFQLGRTKEKPEMPEDEKAKNGVIAFLTMVDEMGIKFVDAEMLVYSKKHKYVGLMDLKFTLASEKHKIVHAGDYKTGSPENKRFYDPETKMSNEVIRPRFEHGIQVAGYMFADIEESGEKYGSTWIFYLDKETGEVRPFEIPYEEQENNFKVFLGLLEAKKSMMDYDEKDNLRKLL